MKLEKEDLLRAFAQSEILQVFKHFMTIKGFTYKIRNGFTLANSSDGEAELEVKFRLWYTQIRAEIKRDNGVMGTFTNLTAKDAISEYKSEQLTEHTLAIKKELTFTPELEDKALSELRKFTELLTGKNKELDVAALYSFIWQAKRKLYNKNVEFHLCPIFYSNTQGSGKTINMDRLTLTKSNCEGNETNLLSNNVAQFLKSDGFDERNRHSFASNLIIKLDEILIEKDQYNVVKSLITDDTVQWRPMRTNSSISRANTASLIATSNIPLESLIFDETGVRRFYQFNVRKFDNETQEGINAAEAQKKALQNIDYISIWKGINEFKAYSDTYHSKFRTKFNEVAEIARNKGDFELFTEEHGISPVGALFIKTTWLNEEFKFWHNQQNSSIDWMKKSYKREFAKIGFEIIKTGGHLGYYVSLSDEARIRYEAWFFGVSTPKTSSINRKELF